MGFTPEEMAPLASHKLRKRRNQIRACSIIMLLVLVGRGLTSIFLFNDYLAAIPLFVMAFIFPLSVFILLRNSEIRSLFYVSIAALMLAVFLIIGCIYTVVAGFLHNNVLTILIGALFDLAVALPCLVFFALTYTHQKALQQEQEEEEEVLPYAARKPPDNETEGLISDDQNN